VFDQQFRPITGQVNVGKEFPRTISSTGAPELCSAHRALSLLNTPIHELDSAAKTRTRCFKGFCCANRFPCLPVDEYSPAYRMQTSTRAVHVSLANALTKGPPPPGNLAVPVFSHRSLVVELYTPIGLDPQKPHTRDEVYVVTRGKGFFFDGEKTHPVEVGSFLFVPAGQVHRFQDFSSDFAVWVIFYGPENGEANRLPVR
jgi:mannose-6-phosphate isomerase-like protein (cupin superfamily)